MQTNRKKNSPIEYAIRIVKSSIRMIKNENLAEVIKSIFTKSLVPKFSCSKSCIYCSFSYSLPVILLCKCFIPENT